MSCVDMLIIPRIFGSVFSEKHNLKQVLQTDKVAADRLCRPADKQLLPQIFLPQALQNIKGGNEGQATCV